MTTKWYVDQPPTWIRVLPTFLFILIVGALIGMRWVFVVGVIVFVIFLIRFAYAFHKPKPEDSQK